VGFGRGYHITDRTPRLIAQGESRTLEFKETLDRPERVAREVVAFANSGGGTLLVGVRDDGTVAGFAPEAGLEEWLAHVGSETIVPPLLLWPELGRAVGSTVLAVRVPSGPSKPHAVREGQHKFTVYVRHGSTTRPAAREEIGRLYQDSGEVRFDASPVPGTTVADLDMAVVERYLQSIRGVPLSAVDIAPEQLLANWGVLTVAEANAPVTLGGMLFFAREVSRFVPHASLKLARFKGVDLGDDYIDRKEVAELLPDGIDVALQFTQRHTNLSARIAGLRREETPEYLEPVVREALVNAFAHRDYSLRGSNVRVFIFDDRLEVRSPGRLPNGVTVEKMRYGAHSTRNPTVVRFLRSLGYGEGDGTGIPRMIKRCKEAGIREPNFEELNGDFVVTLWSSSFLETQ